MFNGQLKRTARRLRSILVAVRCFSDDTTPEYNELASITLSNQHSVIRALFTRQAAGVLFTPGASADAAARAEALGTERGWRVVTAKPARCAEAVASLL